MSLDKMLQLLGAALIGGSLALFFVEGVYGFVELKQVARLMLSPAGILLIGLGNTLEHRRKAATHA